MMEVLFLVEGVGSSNKAGSSSSYFCGKNDNEDSTGSNREILLRFFIS